MAFVPDFTQPATDVLLAQINFDNGTAVTPDQIRFGQVAALPATDPGGLNSTVYVATVQGADFEGSQYFRYNRIDIGTVPGSRPTTFALGGAVNVSDLLPRLNSLYSLNLTRDDIVDAHLPVPLSGQSADFTLQIAPQSLLWMGSVTLSVSG